METDFPPKLARSSSAGSSAVSVWAARRRALHPHHSATTPKNTLPVIVRSDEQYASQQHSTRPLRTLCEPHEPKRTLCALARVVRSRRRCLSAETRRLQRLSSSAASTSRRPWPMSSFARYASKASITWCASARISVFIINQLTPVSMQVFSVQRTVLPQHAT